MEDEEAVKPYGSEQGNNDACFSQPCICVSKSCNGYMPVLRMFEQCLFSATKFFGKSCVECVNEAGDVNYLV